MIQFKYITYTLFFLMLFFPILGFVYLYLNLPKSINHLFVYIVFFHGIIFFLVSNKKLNIPKFVFPLIFYMLYIPIRSHLADLPERQLLTQIYYDIVNTSIFFIIVIIQNTKFDNRFIATSFIIIKFTLIIAAIVSIFQVFNPFLLEFVYEESELEWISQYQVRRMSIFGYEPLNLGLSFIPLLSAFVGLYYYQNKRLSLVFLILGGITAILSNTRFIIIAYLIICFQFVLINRNKIISIISYIFAFVILIILLYKGLEYIGYNIPEWYKERLFPEGSIEETTRYKAIDTFKEFFPKKWAFGTGVHLTEEIKKASDDISSSQIHVGYLSHLVSYGVFGSFLLFSFWFLLAKKLYKTAKYTNYWGSFFAFLTYFWAQATLVHYSIFFYGLIFALILDKYNTDNYLLSNLVKKRQPN